MQNILNITNPRLEDPLKKVLDLQTLGRLSCTCRFFSGLFKDELHIEKQSKLTKALLSGNFELVKALENQGASFLYKDKDGLYPLIAAVYGGSLELVRYIEEKLKSEAVEQWATVDTKKFTNKFDSQIPTNLSQNPTYGELADWYEKYKNAAWCVTYDQKVLEEMRCTMWNGDGGWSISTGRGVWLSNRLVRMLSIGRLGSRDKPKASERALYSPNANIHEDVVKAIREQLNELRDYMEFKAGKQSNIINKF